jgi:uncharacterized protein
MSSALAPPPVASTVAELRRIDVKPNSPAFVWPTRRALLSAEWLNLVMLNYEVDPEILAPLVPVGTELDEWHGRTYASIVGFEFLRSRFFGMPIPLQGNFEEVNLRFYIRREVAGELRRGVVFVRELAPRRAVALVANALYGEKYLTVPMGRRIAGGDAELDIPPRELEYRWQFAGRTHRVALQTAAEAQALVAGSLEEFIAEHYWGYTALPRGRANEYHVAHPSWRICPAASAELDCDVAALYGAQFAPYLCGEPASAFWADGSAVRVYRGRRVKV